VRAYSDGLSLRLRAAVLVAAAAALCWVVRGASASGDYLPGKPVDGDNAAPAVNALIHSHLRTAASHQPLMGLVSLVWRVPFSGLAAWSGGGHQVTYLAGAIACLIIAFGAAWWLAGRATSFSQCVAAAAAAALIAGGPITTAAVRLGHPEEILTALLASASVICAGENRRRAAAVLLGLAVGTKPWALLATPCVLLALPRPRVAPAALAAAVAAPTAGLLPLLDPATYERASRHISALHFANPMSLWWPLSGAPAAPTHYLPFSLTRTGVTAIAFGLAAAGIWAYARRTRKERPQGRHVDALALFCVLGLLRCVADPAPVTYYLAALVIPLALWETGIRRRFPVLAALVSLLVYEFPRYVSVASGVRGPLGVSVVNAVWVAGAAALGVYLVRNAVGPRALTAPGEPDPRNRQDAGRASGWRGSPSSGIGSQTAA
jgi:hypothetical protein